jgi:hypothetical protein
VILGQFGVAFGHLDVCMAKDLGQFVQFAAVHHVPAPEGVPEIVESELLDPVQVQNFDPPSGASRLAPGTGGKMRSSPKTAMRIPVVSAVRTINR